MCFFKNFNILLNITELANVTLIKVNKPLLALTFTLT
jgi:hypothetical protein